MASPSSDLGVFARRIVEAAAKRTLGVDLAETETLRGQLVEAVADLRLADRLSKRMAWLVLAGGAGGNQRGQDKRAPERIDLAGEVREVARIDSHMLYAIRLRNAFCWGTGITGPTAKDDEVQALLDDFWDAPQNRAEITSPEAQWRAGMDLWEVCNLYHVVFADGLDGRVLLAGLQHDQVRDVVRDPLVWGRVIYYMVTEYVYEWDWRLNQLHPNPTRRIVYYEAFDGMAEVAQEVEAGRAPPTSPDFAPGHNWTAPPADRLRKGQIVHVAINRRREQAFGEPEMRTNLKWAAAFNDLMGGQVEKARAAQSYLMKVTASGAATPSQLTDVAMRAVGRTSPLSAAFGSDLLDNPDQPRAPSPGSQWWQNEAVKAEPFNLDSGSTGAKNDLESASSAFAAGTNFPAHYFFGDPGSLAGAMAVELPVLKLTDIDQAVWEHNLRKLCELRIRRAIDVGLLTERRPPTDEEVAAQIDIGKDGMVDRDLSFTIQAPPVLRRNLPELMQLVVDGATTFDPMGGSEPLQRTLLSYFLGELLEVPDTAELLDHIFVEGAHIGGGMPPPMLGDPAGGPTSTGPDGQQHPSGNPMGTKQQSAVVEAAMRALWERLQDPDDELQALVEAGAPLEALVEAAKPHDIPNSFGRGPRFGLGGRFAGKFWGPGGGHRSRNGHGPIGALLHGRFAERLRGERQHDIAGDNNHQFPNAIPRFSDEALAHYQQQETAYALDPGPEAGADAAWLASLRRDEKAANKALNSALGPDLAKYIDRQWGKDAQVRRRLLAGDLSIEDAEQMAHDNYMEAENRRTQREMSRTMDYGFKRQPTPCFVCGRFKRRPSDVCHHCGDDPVQIGTKTSKFDRAYGYA